MYQKESLRATCQTQLRVTVTSLWLFLKGEKRKKIKILTPLLITSSWLWVLILSKPLDSSWSQSTVLEVWAYCLPIYASWELKPPFYYLQTLSPYFLFGFGRQRNPRFWPASGGVGHQQWTNLWEKDTWLVTWVGGMRTTETKEEQRECDDFGNLWVILKRKSLNTR